MNGNKDLDRMMEDFLSDNHVEDKNFSENVMASLPQQPRLVWITSIYPVMGLITAMLLVWEFELWNPQTLMTWGAKLSVLWHVHLGVSATVSVSMILGALAVIGFFVSEKVKDW